MFRLTRVWIVGLLWAAVATANQVGYQGILTNAEGDSLLNGPHDFSFSIFSSETGGTARWTEVHPDVAVTNGVYSVMLGSFIPLPDSIGAMNWLQITVQGTTLTPRLPINADFRAIEARHAENADSVNHIAASRTAQPNKLLALDAQGKFPESVLPFTLDSILAGQGLTGIIAEPGHLREGRNTLDERLTINVGAGDGINVNADQVSAVLGTSISTAEIDNNAVTNAKIADDAVNSAKVQNNTLTTADIVPDVVSSVDGVTNDGGTIDLIAGANISITPNDAANTITIAAAGGGGGDPDSVFDSEIYARSFVVTPDGTIEAARAHLRSDGTLDLINESGEVRGTVWADGLSFTTRDSTKSTAIDSFGLATGSHNGRDFIRINIDGTWTAVQDSQYVAGLDPEGELWAKSFWVRDPLTGDTLIHLASDGNVYVGEDGNRVLISPEHVSVFSEDTDSWTIVDRGGVSVTDSNETRGVISSNDGLLVADAASQDAIQISTDGTIAISQDGQTVAGLDGDGEIYARSFYTIDDDGDTVAHLDNNGNLALPDGAQITVGGQPIGGSIGNSIEFTDGANSALLVAEGLSVESGGESRAVVTGSGLATSSEDNSSYVDMQFDGTWEAKQGGQVVSGLDTNGELYAKSFYVRDPESGDTLAHLNSDGYLELFDGERSIIVGGAGVLAQDPGTGEQFDLGPGGFNIVQGGQVVAGSDLNGEIFAKSFYVQDPESGDTLAHLNSDGFLELFDGERSIIVGGAGVLAQDPGTGEQFDLGPGGFNIVHGGQVVAGSDLNGEIFAKSFYVLNPTNGDTLLHITSSGQIVDQSGAVLFNGTNLVRDGINDVTISAESGVSATDGAKGTGISRTGLMAADFDTGNLVQVRSDGTWEAQREFLPIAALDSTGEIIAKSFEVRDSVTGVTKAHLTNSGNLELPQGAQVLIGGVPIGGGGGTGDEIEFQDGSNSTYLNAEGLGVINGTVSNSSVTGTNVAVSNDANTSYMDMQYDGTWEAKQNGVVVAGLQPNGEIHAKSFEVRDSLTGAIKAHLTNSGGLTATGTVSGQYVTGSTSVYSQSINGSTTLFSDIAPGYMRSQVLLNNVQQSGWTFFNNGTMQQWIDPAGAPPPMLNMQTTADGYWQFGMPVFFGNPANFNYLSGGTLQQGVMTSGNMTINGKLWLTGVVDPVICELFPAHPDFEFVPGMVVVADRDSEFIIPCNATAQTSVIGVIPPDEKVDERAHILVTIMGYAASFKEDGTRLEMRVKADASYGAIKRGDLLTTSPTAGHAMLAADPKLGSIVGKALESLADGTGEIKVLVTLQ